MLVSPISRTRQYIIPNERHIQDSHVVLVCAWTSDCYASNASGRRRAKSVGNRSFSAHSCADPASVARFAVLRAVRLARVRPAVEEKEEEKARPGSIDISCLLLAANQRGESARHRHFGSRAPPTGFFLPPTPPADPNVPSDLAGHSQACD